MQETAARAAQAARAFHFPLDIAFVNVCYHDNKADINDAPHYDYTCLLQLSLNWI
jgi:hypothetical protein